MKNLIVQIRSYLQKELGLTLHPKKITLQHYRKGVKFVGAYIGFYAALQNLQIAKTNALPDVCQIGQIHASGKTIY
ncbi:hypothetical protein FACS189428_0190 [Clostridia bacterium]|nr:hypothetical protein FACS189428_0190 [Clostridia bacterium]